MKAWRWKSHWLLWETDLVHKEYLCRYWLDLMCQLCVASAPCCHSLMKDKQTAAFQLTLKQKRGLGCCFSKDFRSQYRELSVVTSFIQMAAVPLFHQFEGCKLTFSDYSLWNNLMETKQKHVNIELIWNVNIPNNVVICQTKRITDSCPKKRYWKLETPENKGISFLYPAWQG